MPKKKKGRYSRGLVSGLMAVCLVAILSLGITVGFAQQALSPIEQLTRLAEVSGDNFGKALDYLGSSAEAVFGYVGDEATNITTARPGRLVTYDNVFVTDDLEVDGTTYLDGASSFTGTTTLQRITFGSQFSESLDFTAGNTTTPGAVASIQNTGSPLICSRVELDIATAPTDTYSFSVGTSTAATTYTGATLIASTTVPTSTPVVLNNVDHVGSSALDSWLWPNGTYVNVAFDSTGTPDNASSTAYASNAIAKLYIDCHTR